MSFVRSSPQVSKRRLRDPVALPRAELFVWMWQTCHLEFIPNSFRRNANFGGLLCEKDVPGCGS